MDEIFEKNNGLSREDLMRMYGEVDGKQNVKYITFVTNKGSVDCFNKVAFKLKLLEYTEKGPKEVIYSEDWTRKTYDDLTHVISEANNVNGHGLKKIFQMGPYKFYLGGIEVERDSTDVKFRDSYIIFENVKLDGTIVKNLMMKYEDVEFVYAV